MDIGSQLAQLGMTYNKNSLCGPLQNQNSSLVIYSLNLALLKLS
jgi:hypothetical protein